MSKKVSRALASGMVMSLVVTTALTTGQVKAAAGAVTRTSGSDRYETAAQVATTNWSAGAKDVVLVSGEGYADAVSASALAKKLNAPILLTTPGTLNSYAKSALATLNPTNVYVIGGNASVSQAVRTQLKASYNLIELKGANRYETNLAVANKLVELGVDPSNTLLVGGEGFSDALSVAPVAASKGEILLLGNNDASTMTSIVSFVKANNSSVTVVGTSNVINEDMYNKLGAVERVNGGATRFETNINVLNKFDSDLKADKLYVANASGDGYADALVASALAGKTASPLVLVDSTGSEATAEAISYIKTKATATTDLNVIGGTGVVSQSTVNSINNAVNPSSNNSSSSSGDNTVSSIEPISLNQFEIVFNTNVDEDTAELEENYKVGTTTLSSSNSHVELINDNTVRVTLVDDEFDISQDDEKTVSVKKGILTENKTETIDTYSEKVEFKDVTAPTLKSVSIRGNNKLVIEFSEAVKMPNLKKVANLIKINDKTLSNYDSTYSEIKEKATNGTESWANKVEFYLNSGLSSGEHTIKIEDGGSDVLEDAAGFSFKETEETVTVDDVDTTPEVEDITCSDDGEIRIKFDRPMDYKTARKTSNYTINDESISGATIDLDEDDTVVKITDIPTADDGDDILRDTVNVLEMSDGVKDAYGNKVEDETRVSFEKEKDETKPTILSAIVIDSTTLRIKFSEDVKYSYATNEDNYELRDANDVDLMKKSGVYIEASSSVDEDNRENTDTYDIKLDKSSYKFNSSEYTLTAEDIVDLATDPNKMDDETITVDGSDDASTSVDDIEALRKSSTEVAIYFDSEMDASSISDKENYYYINGEGESEELPDDVDIDVSDDNKTVVIDFEDTDKTVYTTDSAPDDEDVVKRIGVKTVQDGAGNDVYVGALRIESLSSSSGPELEEDTFKLYKDGDDVKAEFQLDAALDAAYEDDFEITSSADSSIKIKPDNAETDGETVTLTFNDEDRDDSDYEGNKADDVMALGCKAELKIVGTESEDIAGRSIQTTDEGQLVYYNEIAPETDRDNYSAIVTVTDGKVTGAQINITMKTPVDDNIVNSYEDDFEFTNATKGDNLEINSVDQKVINGVNTLVFTVDLDECEVEEGDEIDITTATDEDDIDLRSEEDGDGKHVDFEPTSKDIRTKSVTAKVESVSKTALKALITEVGNLTDSNYTSASWTAVKTELAQAEALYEKTTASQTEVDKEKSALSEAIENLVSIKDLNASIKTAEALTSVKANYTTTTWATMEEALTAAQTVAADTDATQADVDAKTTALATAINGLLPVVTVDQADSVTTPGKTAVVASLPTGIDAAKYNLTIDGTALSYDSATNKFSLTIDGTFTVEQVQAKISVTAK